MGAPLPCIRVRTSAHTQLCRDSPASRAPCAQGMFFDASALSGCNRLLIHKSFEAQTPSAWVYDDWASAVCDTPLPPAPPLSPPLPPFQPGAAYGDKGSLQGALYEWLADAVAAEAKYSHISTWDVTAVTDMDELLALEPLWDTYSYDVPGRFGGPALGFDEDINAWDVSQVTTMEVSRHHTSLVGGGDREHTQEVCGCAAQRMFFRQTNFNQPLAAWDVGRVTNMKV